MLVAAVPAVIVCHEMGHVIAGRLGGYYVAAAGMGGGRRPWRIPLSRRFNLYLGPVPLAGGATIAFPARSPMPRWAAFSLHYGGIVGQLVLQGALHLVYWRVEAARPWLVPALALNALVIVANLIPWRSRLGGMGVESDGARAARALRGAAVGGLRRAPDDPPAAGGEPPLPPAAFDVLDARLDSPVGRFVLDVVRARHVDDERSRAFLSEAEPPAGAPALYVDLWRTLRARDRTP